MRRRTALLLAPPLLVVAAVAVLFVEGRIAASREYVEDPGYEIDRRIRPDAELAIDRAATTRELLVAGDSTVAGLGVDRIVDTLPVQIAQRLADGRGHPIDVVGVGVSGARTEQVADQLRERIERDGDVDVIVIEVGSNDVTHLTRLGTLERQTRAMLEYAQQHADVVVLGGAGRLDTRNFLPPLRQVIAWRSRQVRSLQGRVARELDVPFVDMGGEVGDIYNRTPGATSSDGFHPAAPGYGVWADALAEATGLVDEGSV